MTTYLKTGGHASSRIRNVTPIWVSLAIFAAAVILCGLAWIQVAIDRQSTPCRCHAAQRPSPGAAE